MDRKIFTSSVELELKITEQYLLVKSKEVEMQVCAGNLSLSPSTEGGVSSLSVGRAVLKLFSAVQKKRSEVSQSSQKPSQFDPKVEAILEKREFLSIREVATLLGISEGSVRRLEMREILHPTRTPGGHRRYSVSEIVRILEMRAEEGGRISRYQKR